MRLSSDATRGATGPSRYDPLAQIFLSLTRNLTANVKKIASRFDQNQCTFNKLVKAQSNGIRKIRSAEDTNMNKPSLWAKLLPLRALKTNTSLRTKLARIATWLLITALKRRRESPPSVVKTNKMY